MFYIICKGEVVIQTWLIIKLHNLICLIISYYKCLTDYILSLIIPMALLFLQIAIFFIGYFSFFYVKVTSPITLKFLIK